jgi:hypothetical protein
LLALGQRLLWVEDRGGDRQEGRGVVSGEVVSTDIAALLVQFRELETESHRLADEEDAVAARRGEFLLKYHDTCGAIADRVVAVVVDGAPSPCGEDFEFWQVFDHSEGLADALTRRGLGSWTSDGLFVTRPRLWSLVVQAAGGHADRSYMDWTRSEGWS